MISSKTADSIRKAISPTFFEQIEQGFEAKNPVLIYGVKTILWIVGFAIVVSLVVLLVGLNALALSYLWGLFVVPVFTAPSLTYLQSAGLILLWGFLKSTTSKVSTPDDVEKQKKTKTERLTNISLPFLKPVIFMALGWIIHAIQVLFA